MAVSAEGYLVWQNGNVGSENDPNTASKDGGGLHLTSFATVELWGTNIRGNQAGRNGGGIYAQGPEVSITLLDNARIFLNHAADNGGGIYAADDVSLLLDEVSFVGDNGPTWGNTADMGAGIYADGVIVRLQGNSRVQHNTAANAGGGIFLVGGSQLHMTGGLIRNNIATTSFGGGVLVAEGEAFLEGVTIQENEAAFGGGVAQLGIVGNSVAITNSQVISNTAVQHGGGLFNASQPLTWVDTNGESQLVGNHAGVHGGAAYQIGAGAQLIFLADPEVLGAALLVAHNSANSSGGAFYNEDGNLGLGGNVLLTHNAAVGDGGAVYQTGGNLGLGGLEQGRLFIEHNEALNGSGGGLYLDNVGVGLALMSNTTIRHNVADNGGGGLYVADNSQLQLLNIHLHHNQAQRGAGLFVSLSQVHMGQHAESCANAQLPANQYCSELRGNVALEEGGAVYVEYASEVLIEQTAVVSNTATAAGGLWNDGLATLQIYNSLFTHNSDKALLVNNNATLELHHTTFADNDWAIAVNNAGATVHHSNNIIWGNDFGVDIAPPILVVGCSISQNGVIGANTDPLFHTTLRGDYRLGVGSPAIDGCGSGADVDMDGVPRPQGANYDAGAFESGRPLILFPTALEVVEGDAGLTPLPFVLTFSEPTQNEVELVVATFSQTALSGADFVPFTQTVTIPMGTISHTIALEVVGDEVYEGDELFVVELSEAVGAELTADNTLVTMVDDDPVSITVANGSAVEGDEGTTSLSFAITLSNPSAFTTTVDFATGYEGDTAVDGVDYQASSGTVIIEPGQTAVALNIRVYGDAEEEADEIFTLRLSNPSGATLVNLQAIGTIVDDDGVKVIFLPLISR